MRIDHYAYQRGTRVAGFGLMLQFGLGLVLLLFGLISRDTVFTFTSIYVLAGSLIWLSLIIIFHQHKLERLEALEDDEIGGGKTDSTSIFETRPDEQRVAARRLALMHKWLMPSVSLALAAFLGLMAWWQWGYMSRLGDVAGGRPTEFHMTPQIGWALAVCLGAALIAFIFSRFVAGMAKQGVWQNLRGGAGHMVGTALLLLVVAVGMAFRIFNNEQVIWWVALAVPFFMGLVALEIVLNFVLNLYRPRIPGEVPRPAFDSRVLSLLAAPDSIVRSINEAVNYQFGFDITSSWGYQLLLRSFVWLIGIGVAAMILLNMMVIVEPHQQAVRLRFGEQVGPARDAGVLWKWPWPFETAVLVDVDKVHQVNLTARRQPHLTPPIQLWTQDLSEITDGTLDPFIVGSTQLTSHMQPRDQFLFDQEEDPVALEELQPGETGYEGEPDDGDVLGLEPIQPAAPAQVDAATAAVSRAFSLVDAEMSLYYRIRRAGGSGQGGLMDFLSFVPVLGGRKAVESPLAEGIFG